VRQVCDGGLRRRGMYLDTVGSLMSNPSFNSSPWMRGAPQVAFSLTIGRMRRRIVTSTRGRPPLLRLFHVQ
jgi:hypothetical protein